MRDEERMLRGVEQRSKEAQTIRHISIVEWLWWASERKNLVLDTFVNLKPEWRFENRSDVREFKAFDNSTSSRLLESIF